MGRNFVNVLNCLQFFINLLMRFPKLLFVFAPVQTSRSKQIRRGGSTVVRVCFLVEKIAVTSVNFFISNLTGFLSYKESY